MYLTEIEYIEMGYDSTEHFSKLYYKASAMIDMYTRHCYSYCNFEEDIDIRKDAVKKAVALQIAYMDETGIDTAEDRQHLANISIGRTSVSYGGTDKKGINFTPYGLTLDALNLLNSVGFGYSGVAYDR